MNVLIIKYNIGATSVYRFHIYLLDSSNNYREYSRLLNKLFRKKFSKKLIIEYFLLHPVIKTPSYIKELEEKMTGKEDSIMKEWKYLS